MDLQKAGLRVQYTYVMMGRSEPKRPVEVLPLAPRKRKFPDMDKPLSQVPPSKRGYTQVYFKDAAVQRIDAYKDKHKLSTRQDAVLHALGRAEKADE